MVITAENIETIKKELHRLRLEVTFESLLFAREVRGFAGGDKQSVWLSGPNPRTVKDLSAQIREMEIAIERYKIGIREQSTRILPRPTPIQFRSGQQKMA